MPLFMDVQAFGPEADLQALVEDYEADLARAAPLGRSLLRYWISEQARTAFCLIEAEGEEFLTARSPSSPALTVHEVYPISEHVLLLPRPGPEPDDDNDEESA